MSFVTIRTFYNYKEALPVKSLLENEGIHFYLMNEQQAALRPDFHNPQYELSLQVAEQDADKAKRILKEHGLFTETPPPQTAKGWHVFDRLTKRIPLLGDSPVYIRVVVLLIITSAIVVGSLVWNNRITPADVLTHYIWCIESITHNDKEIQAHSSPEQYVVSYYGNGCVERMDFMLNNEVRLPGVYTYPVRAMYELNAEQDSIIISGAHTLSAMYDGRYKLLLDANYNLTLQSDVTTISCRRAIR